MYEGRHFFGGDSSMKIFLCHFYVHGWELRDEKRANIEADGMWDDEGKISNL